VLIKIINSAAGFPVELIYATRAESIGGLGTLSARLPRPDTVVTHTLWDVYVPEGLSYRSPQTNMDRSQSGRVGSSDELVAPGGGGQVTALRIAVPTSGVHYRFTKLYANQSNDAPSFQLAYASHGGAVTSEVISVVATLALWLGLLLWRRRVVRSVRSLRGNIPALVSLGLGLVLLCITLGYLQRGVAGPVTVSTLLLLAVGGWHRLSRYQRWQATRRLYLDAALAALEPETAAPAAPAAPIEPVAQTTVAAQETTEEEERTSTEE